MLLTAPATSSTICIGSRNWRRNRTSRLLLRLRERVGAIFLQTALGFGLAESTGGGDILLLQGVLNAEDVPCRLLARWGSEWWCCGGHALLLLETRQKLSEA